MFGSKSKSVIFDEKKLKPKRNKKTVVPPSTPELDDKLNFTFDATPTATVVPKKSNKHHRAKRRLPFWKNRRAIGVALIVLSLLIALGVNPALNYFNAQELVAVAVASVAIERGTIITKDMFTEASYSVTAVLPEQVLAADSVVGKYAATSIVAGEIIHNSKLASASPFDNSYLQTLPAGKKAMSVSIDRLSSSISAKLEQGDIVSVYVPQAQDSKDIRDYALLPPELVYVEVLSCTNSDGYDITTTPDKSNLESPLPSTVTLAVDDLQATILAGSELHGGVHLALVARSTTGKSDELLGAQHENNQKIIAVREQLEGGDTDEK